MLTSLTISNVVLIEHLHIDFHTGLCALTGETGAGKSILLDSLGLAIGDRAESRLVRKDADKAHVTAVFELDTQHPAFVALDEFGIDHDTGEPVILRRTLTADGKSRAFVNDHPVSASSLRDVGQSLIEIHGQFDTHGLLNPATHRSMLDAYAHIKTDLPDIYAQWKEAQRTLYDLQETSAKLRDEEVYLREAVEDLDELAPEKGEETTLNDLRTRLAHQDQVLEGLNGAYALLTQDEDPITKAAGMINRIADKGGEATREALALLDQATEIAQNAVSVIADASHTLDSETQDLESIDERLHRLRTQARKHGCSIDDLQDKRNELADQLSLIEHGDERIADAMKIVEKHRAAFHKEAQKVSDLRQKAAQSLSKGVKAELAPLKMGKAEFVVRVETLAEDKWNAYGMDDVRFLVATNAGADAGPLNKIASGGEMARFMLALRVVMAQTETGRTIIFDEIDAGVGGAVADAIGERLADLAHDHQVMVVTHAPQIAARASHQWIVAKGGADVITTDVRYLQKTEARREEIARMLSGATITTEARAAADKLLESAAA